MRLLLLSVLVTGCGLTGGPAVKKPGQDRAVDMIWRQLYGETGFPPVIEWVDSDYLWSDVKGFTWAGTKVVLAANDLSICGTLGCNGVYRFSDTALAHELMHYRTWKRTGDVDPAHFRGDWNLASQANDALTADEQHRLANPDGQPSD